MAKAGRDFKSVKSTLDKTFGEKPLNSQPSMTKKGVGSAKSSKSASQRTNKFQKLKI